MNPALNFDLIGARRVKPIRQTDFSECGLACLAMISTFWGSKVDLNYLRRRFPNSMRGTSLRELLAIADELGFIARPVRVSLNAVRNLSLPAVIHWDLKHFVVLEGFKRGRVQISDPAIGRKLQISFDDFAHHFTGVALELQPTEDFRQGEVQRSVRLRALWGRVTGWKRVVAQVLVLTLILQVFVLASPYYMQLAIDTVVPTLDGNLLLVLAVGFGMLTIFNTAATMLRSLVLLSAGTTMGFAVTTNIGRRLFRLPLAWFERRHVGDILSRFQSVHPIKNTLTEGLLSSLVDGVLAVIIFFIMLWYSAKLAAVSFLAFSLYWLVRSVSFKLERTEREAAIVTIGKQQSALIESLRGMTTLRLFGRENQRFILWQDRLTDETNSAVSVERIRIWQLTANDLLFGLENIVIVWLAVGLVLAGGFSVGMVVAYIAYKQQFMSRAASLVDQAVAFRMLKLHLERLGDIALEDEDISFDAVAGRSQVFHGRVELKGVHYQYAPSEPRVIAGVDLQIEPGSHVVLTGPSGGGKSTLAKIILGLSEPIEGEVLIDGVPLRKFGYRNFRSQIAAVLQEDHLFAGTIADNIALFEEQVDAELMHQSARTAAIHEEIEQMPMRYDTLVGDMGSALSGGQKARILLARALYRRPKLLLLDEGTAHLDPSTEAKVNDGIADMRITRVIIAHREETVRAGEKIYVLNGGSLHKRC